MSGTISPRDRLQLWVNTFLLKQKENSGSVTATFRDLEIENRNLLHLHNANNPFYNHSPQPGAVQVLYT